MQGLQHLSQHCVLTTTMTMTWLALAGGFSFRLQRTGLPALALVLVQALALVTAAWMLVLVPRSSGLQTRTLRCVGSPLPTAHA